MNSTRVFCCLLTVCLSISVGTGTAFLAQEGEPETFVTSWILVRLRAPLKAQYPDGSFSEVTGNATLDALIVESGVQKIGYALPVTMREPRNFEPLRRHGLDRTYRFHVPEGSDIEQLVERFSRPPEVEYAEPDYLDQPGGVSPPDDLLFAAQWYFDQATNADMDGPEAWDLAQGDQVIIAVLDSGVDSLHPDLVGKLLPGYDFVNDDVDPDDVNANSHGTRVASIVSANTNNAEGIAGACWNCRIMPVKVCQEGLGCTASWFADAAVWATDHGARVINYSAGGTSPSQTRLSGVNYAYDAGVVLAGGAGNGNNYLVVYPKARREFIAVGGTNHFDNRAVPYSCSGTGGSNYGNEVDVVAAADSILGATIGGGYVSGCGNSFSGPQVVGLIGIIETINPAAGREEVRHLIRAGAEDQVGTNPAEDTPGYDIYKGWGRVNMERTVLAAQSSVTLRVDGKEATRVFFDMPNLLASSYDFIRGDLGALSETAAGVDLSTVVCLENDSPDADTAGGNEDLETPSTGQGYFYLGRFTAPPGPGSYGGSSRNRDRMVFPLSNAAWVGEGNQTEARFGTSVGAAGDVNGDGYGDVIVGAELYDNNQVDEGAAFVYLGSSSGLGTTPAWTAEGNQTGSSFGWTVATAGDVNGDGYDDVIVGAPLHDNGQTDAGRVYVYHGSGSGLLATPDWTAEGDQAGAEFGFRVRSAGDVNADGYDDVIIGASLYDNGQTDEGRAYVYHGSPSGLGTSPAWTAEADQAGALFGRGVGTAGDIDGDGYDDVVVGAPKYDNGHTDEGRLYVYRGTVSGLSSVPWTTREIDSLDARLGYAAVTAGDVNGDGFSDVIASAYLYTNAETQEGAAVVYLGSALGLATSPAWSYENDEFFSSFGISAESAGDVNNDGYADVVVGSELDDGVRSDEGLAVVFHGSAGGLSPARDWTVAGMQPAAELGWRSATAGDINGDGYDDVIVGARSYDNGELNEGAAFVYLGSPSGLEIPPPTSDCDP